MPRHGHDDDTGDADADADDDGDVTVMMMVVMRLSEKNAMLQPICKKLVLGPKKLISSVFKSSSTGNLKFSETSLNSRTVISNERFQNLSALLFT